MSAKIVLFDIETAPTLGWAWQKYDTNLIKIVQNWYMLSFAYKTLEDDKVTCHALPDYTGFHGDMTNDFKLVAALWKVLDGADIVVAHNGDHFDIRFAQGRFLDHGLPPPSPFKSVDTLKIARKHFKFESNKLSDLGEFLGVGTKVIHTGFSLWEGCMAGEPAAWDKMKEYNSQDVNLLEEVYLKMRPWSPTHPNVNLYAETSTTSATGAEPCPSCGGNHTQRRGRAIAKTQVRQRHHCQDCGHWFVGQIIKSK